VNVVDLETQKVLKQCQEVLPEVLQLPEPDRSRCLMGLAYEYFIADLEETAFDILKKADPKYFGEQLGKDMKINPDIKQIVFRISAKLIEMGLVKVVEPEEK